MGVGVVGAHDSNANTDSQPQKPDRLDEAQLVHAPVRVKNRKHSWLHCHGYSFNRMLMVG